jgi:hypothetical protein
MMLKTLIVQNNVTQITTANVVNGNIGLKAFFAQKDGVTRTTRANGKSLNKDAITASNY